MRKTVFSVDKRECCSCGLCEGVCQSKAIFLKRDEQGFYRPVINQDLCEKCGICYDVCPGDKVEENSIYRTLGQSMPDDYIKGNVLECFNAKMTDVDLREKCTSGGMVTGIISYLLKKQQYDVAFCVNTYDYSSQVKTVPINSIEDLDRTVQSRYVTVSHSELVDYILHNRDKRVIIVAVGCAMTGIRTIIKKYRLDKDKYLCLGLFCACQYSYRTWDYFRLYSPQKVLEELQFRCKNGRKYAYGMIKAKFDNEYKVMHTIHRAYIKNDFAMERCLYCTDLLNVFSDISFGDNNTKSKDGESCTVIVRTSIGNQILKEMYSEKLFLREDILIDEIRDVQGRYVRGLYADIREKLDGGSHIYRDRTCANELEWAPRVRELKKTLERKTWALNSKNLKKLWLINQLRFLKLRITNRKYLLELKPVGKMKK